MIKIKERRTALARCRDVKNGIERRIKFGLNAFGVYDTIRSLAELNEFAYFAIGRLGATSSFKELVRYTNERMGWIEEKFSPTQTRGLYKA